nr:hypothetical protein [Chionoecetes opilio bacilliform virus]
MCTKENVCRILVCVMVFSAISLIPILVPGSILANSFIASATIKIIAPSEIAFTDFCNCSEEPKSMISYDKLFEKSSNVTNDCLFQHRSSEFVDIVNRTLGNKTILYIIAYFINSCMERPLMVTEIMQAVPLLYDVQREVASYGMFGECILDTPFKKQYSPILEEMVLFTPDVVPSQRILLRDELSRFVKDLSRRRIDQSDDILLEAYTLLDIDDAIEEDDLLNEGEPGEIKYAHIRSLLSSDTNSSITILT